jgi:prepilin-type N-terminal cleavage/methylation domain-containing protein
MFSKRLHLGFSLLEVLCALVIFCTGILAIIRFNTFTLRDSVDIIRMQKLHFFMNVIVEKASTQNEKLTKTFGLSWNDPSALILSDGIEYLSQWFNTQDELKMVICHDDRPNSLINVSLSDPSCSMAGPLYLKAVWMQSNGEVRVYSIPIGYASKKEDGNA